MSAEPYDCLTRFMVASRRPRVAPYLVDLLAYDRNGFCICKDFTCHMEPLIVRGITPLQAVAGEMINLPENVPVEDALRCFHIREARMKFADITLKHLYDDQKKKADEARRANPSAREE